METSPHSSLSPSLQGQRETPAFELKCLLTAEQGAQVLDWARQNLTVDPHANPDRDHTYEVHTLYFDTPEFDVFRKSDNYKRKKYRLRRYGQEPTFYLEEKKKIGERVTKRRTKVDSTVLSLLQTPLGDAEWEGQWFQRRLHIRRLKPTCQVSYERYAFFGESVDGPLRLTLDRHLRGQSVRGWDFVEIINGHRLLDSGLLLELKYTHYLPTTFKNMLQDFGILSRPLSKYRLAFTSCGLDAGEGRADV